VRIGGQDTATSPILNTFRELKFQMRPSILSRMLSDASLKSGGTMAAIRGIDTNPTERLSRLKASTSKVMQCTLSTWNVIVAGAQLLRQGNTQIRRRYTNTTMMAWIDSPS